jgi:hypothetical protein
MSLRLCRPSTARLEGFKQLRWPDAQGYGKTADVNQRNVPLTPLDSAKITAGESALQRQSFLRHSPGSSQTGNMAAQLDTWVSAYAAA